MISEPKTNVVEQQCPCCGNLLRVGVQFHNDVFAIFLRYAGDKLNLANQRKWSLRSFGGTIFAEGYAIPSGEVVHVREVVKADP